MSNDAHASVTTNTGVTAGLQVYLGDCTVALANLTPAAAVATLIIYDGTSTSGPKVLTLQAATSGNSVNSGGIRIRCRTGAFVAVTGVGAEAQIGIE